VYAFYKRPQRNGDNYIVLREEDNKAYYAPQYLLKILTNSENTNEFIHYGNNIYGLDNFKDIITIKKMVNYQMEPINGKQ